MEAKTVYVTGKELSNGKHHANYGEMNEPVIALLHNGNIEELRFFSGGVMSKYLHDFKKEPVTILHSTEAIILTKEDAEKVEKIIKMQIQRCSVLDEILTNTIEEDLQEALQILNK